MRLSLLGADGTVVRLCCEGAITHGDMQPGRDPLAELVGVDCFQRKVLLDLSRTNYIDSSGISWLLIQHKHFLQGGGKLVLHSVSPTVDQVLRLLKMSLVLNIAADEAAARELCRDRV